MLLGVAAGEEPETLGRLKRDPRTRHLPVLVLADEPRRHDLLAGIYLRRGFLDSAADEWIAAVEEDGPDPASLGGLARVAAARGLTEDAEMFEQSAKELASSSV